MTAESPIGKNLYYKHWLYSISQELPLSCAQVVVALLSGGSTWAAAMKALTVLHGMFCRH